MKCNNCKHLRDGWCNILYDSPDPDIERECDSYKTRSNYDRIKQMSVEDMAKMLANEIPHGDCYGCNLECTTYMGDKFKDCCINAYYRWLEQEVE